MHLWRLCGKQQPVRRRRHVRDGLGRLHDGALPYSSGAFFDRVHSWAIVGGQLPSINADERQLAFDLVPWSDHLVLLGADLYYSHCDYSRRHQSDAWLCHK